MIKFIVGPNGVGKSLFLSKLTGSNDLLLETNQNTSDINSDTKESFLMQIINKVKAAELTALNTSKATLIGSTTIPVAFNGRTVDINFNGDIKSFKGIVNSSALKKMSSGEQTLAGLNLIKSNISTFAGSKIFLDEVDAFLHPSAYEEVKSAIMDIASAGNEIYIATHSPELLKSFAYLDYSTGTIEEKFEIYYFKEYIDAGTRITNINSYKFDYNLIINEINRINLLVNASTVAAGLARSQSKKIQNIYNAIQSDQRKQVALINKLMSTSLSELFFEKNILLVEGPTEIIYYLFKSKPFNGKTIPTFGKYFMPIYLTIAKECGIDYHIVFDQDTNQANSAGDLLNNELRDVFNGVPKYTEHVPNLETQKSFSSAPDIESDKVLRVFWELL